MNTTEHAKDCECEDCCTHSDVDDLTCLICGADMIDEMAGRADWAVDASKDGSAE